MARNVKEKDNVNEKDYEEIFGDGAEELSDAVEDYSDFELGSDREKSTPVTKPKKKHNFQRDIGSPASSPPRQSFTPDLRSTPEGDRDEDEIYTPQPIRRIKRKSSEKRKYIKKRRGIREGDGDMDEDEIIPPTEEMTPLLESRQIIERDFAEMMPKKKISRAKNQDIDIDKYYDQAAERLYKQMIQYADQDSQGCQTKNPSTCKLDHLDYIVSELTKPYMTEALMDSGILDAIRYWLEPLPDRSLPNITIIEQMFKVLNKLPITTEHLLSSRVGRIVFFYQDSPRSDERIKRIASDLVRKWTRKIYNISTNYKDKNFKRVEFHPETMAEAQAAVNNDIPEDRPQTSSSVRAQIPQQASFDYDVIPEVRIIQTRKRADDPYKHIKQTMARMRRNQKKVA